MVKTTMMNNSKITLSPISEKVNLFTTWWIGKHSKEYPERPCTRRSPSDAISWAKLRWWILPGPEKLADYSCTIYRKSRSWEKATWPEISNSRSMKTFLTGVMQKVYSDWEISPGFQKGAVQKLFFAVKPIGREKGWWHVAKHKIRHQQRTTEPDPHRRWRQQLPGQRAWTSSPRLCWYGSGDSEIYSKDSVLRKPFKGCFLDQFTSFYFYSHWKLLLAFSKQTLRIFTQQMYKYLFLLPKSQIWTHTIYR